jgi:tetratricopeptide (TPR) repeat protein
MKTVKIFVSSPMDVSAERTVAHRVIGRLALEFAYHFQIESVMSELEPAVATDTPQASITRPSETDIVVVLLWSRIGTRLPDDPRFKTDDPTARPTGTEWEFYNAFRSHQAKGEPDILVYRKTERVQTVLDDEAHVMEALRQKRELEQFLDQWFRNADRSWKAWFHSFGEELELEHLLDTHLRKLIIKRIEATPQTADAPTGKAIEGNPFRGLSSFDIEDAPLFFGRTAALNELRNVLETQNARRCGFVVVTGSSGSGKSSLVKAGLLADLQNPNRVGRVALCRYAVMRPSDHDGDVLLAVADTILSMTAFPELAPVGWKVHDLGRAAAEDPQRVVEALRHAASIAAKGANLRDASDVRLCLVIDQFEEIFTAGIPKAALDGFTRLLNLLARSEVVWIVVTLRSDFYHRLDEVPDILLLAERGYYRLKSPLPTEVGEMIRKPAQLAGLRFERHSDTGASLDDVLQDDAISDPTALPLLEFALQELWTQRTAGGLLTFSAYERMGRMTGAIAERAESLIANLSPMALDNIPTLLRALITVSHPNDEPTAATIRRSMVATTSECAEILDRLIEARLVVTDDLDKRGDPKCRLAHERLIQTWPRLRKLADADRAFLEARDRLRGNAETWEARNRPPDLLLPAGSRLVEGEQYIHSRRDELDHHTVEFVEVSIAAENEKHSREIRRSRSVAIGFAVLAAIVFVLFVVTYLKQREVAARAEEAHLAANKATRGFGLAINAAAALSAGTGTSRSNIESVMEQADGMLQDVAAASNTDPTVVEQRAALLLSFAATSERLGDYGQQLERVKTSRQILAPVCEQSKAPSCFTLLTSTFEAEGNYLIHVGRAADGIATYQQALQPRPQTAQGDSGDLLARARTQAALSRALTSTDKAEDALRVAKSCSETAQLATGDAAPVQFAKADCEIAKAMALETSGDDGASARAGQVALGLLQDLNTRTPQDIHYIEAMAQAHERVAIAQRASSTQQEVVTHLEDAVAILDPVVRSNPQNDQVATLLSELFNLEERAYRHAGRNDLAARAMENSTELARNRIAGPRTAFWHATELSSLRTLGRDYSILGRNRDALHTAQSEVSIRLERIENPTAPWPAEVLLALLSAGQMAIAIADGVTAADVLIKALGHAERQLEAERAAGKDLENEYSTYSNIAYRVVLALSDVTAKMLPEDKRVSTLADIVGRISHYAAEDPRAIPFHTAEGRSLYQWAVALEQANDLVRAREIHERASKAGWRTSTIVLRRWYLEGLAGTKPDLKRAMELETLAAGQSEPPTVPVEVRDRATAAATKMPVYFLERDGNTDPMADEVHRLTRYFGAEIPNEIRGRIAKLYDLARQDGLTISQALAQWQNIQRNEQQLPPTSIDTAASAALEALKARDLAGAANLLIKIRPQLDERKQGSDRANLMAWGKLADIANEIEHDHDVGKDAQLAQRLAALREDAVNIILAVDASGSSPRMAIAEELEQIADRMRAVGQADNAIKLYRRAIDFRSHVRVDDPDNADCQCHIAYELRAVAEIEKQRQNFDAAMPAYQRALNIYEDLDWLEPESGWNRQVADVAHDLAELLGGRGERTALLHAQTAAAIRKDYADRNSADSPSRIQYADALEDVSKYARVVAREEKGRDPKAADADFRLSVESRLQANAIRESVLTVDPRNGECRCHVGSNLSEIARIYEDWGRKDAWFKTLADAVAADRDVLKAEPSNPQWQYNLGNDLLNHAKAHDGDTSRPHELIVVELTESVGLMRPLVRSSSFPGAKDNAVRGLISISDNALFVGQDQTALAAADEGLELRPEPPDDLVLEMNKAHALMFLGRSAEAHSLYLRNMGKQIGSLLWDRAIANDFTELKKSGRSDPLMDQVLQELKD